MKIRLSDADRERLGCPDVLDASVDVLSVRDAEALETATGIEPGEALRLMWPVTELVGETLRYRLTPKGMRLRVWLGLHRAGVQVPFDELDFDYTQFTGFGEVKAEGKADGSPSAEPNTASTSPTSGRRTKSKT